MNGVLVIIGNAGDGKTTLAVNILDRLKQQGYIVLVFSDPKLLEESIDPDRQIVYFVDDAFGTLPCKLLTVLGKKIKQNNRLIH
jgi:ABC-type glutathione transport system ATPase component